MGRITSTQAMFFSPGTNWAGAKGRKNSIRQRLVDPLGCNNKAVGKQKKSAILYRNPTFKVQNVTK